jgi:uroporphyrinogen-III decarboxylase
MNGRERLISVLSGKKVDRIPVAPFIFYNLIDEFYDRKDLHSLDEGTGSKDYVQKGIELYEYFGFDIILRTANVFEYLRETTDDEGKWLVSEEHKGDDQDWSILSKVKTPDKTLTQMKNYHRNAPYEIVEAVTEYFIKDEDDFEQFVKYQPPLPRYQTGHITHARELLKDKGLVAPWAQGAFNSASIYRNVQDLLTDAYTAPEFYNRQMNYFSTRMLSLIKQMATAGADIVCCGGNVANGTMAGPRFFEEHVYSYEASFTQAVKDMGLYYLYHNCGDAKNLYTQYATLGFNIFETLTAPPYADNDLDLAVKTFDNKKSVLSGGIDQIDFLVHASPDEVRTKVKDVLEIVKPYGNFILAASDYFSEGTPYENLKAFADAGKEYGVL